MYWQQQIKEPLFPDLLWSKPENKQHAGKLLIIGGNLHSVKAPAEAYAAALKAGIGSARVLLPDSLAKTVGHSDIQISYAPTNKSGGFSRQALSEWLTFAQASDGVLLAGDTARNSETAVVMETFLEKYSGPVCITQDCLDQFVEMPKKLFERRDTMIVASFGQLQKMWHHLHIGDSLTQGAGLPHNVELLHDLTSKYAVKLITKQVEQIVIAVNGNVSTTPSKIETWRVTTAASGFVWWLQNLDQPFEALTTSQVA